MRITWLFAALLALPLLLSAQPKPPVASVPAARRAYLAGDVAALRSRLPGLQKTLPRSPATRFYTAYCAYKTDADDQVALRAYSDIIRDSPDFAEAYHARAELFANKGLDDRAIADASKALELTGASAPGLYYTSRANHYYRAGNLPAALADYKAAIGKEPADAANYRGLINTALKAGAPAEAETVLRDALAGAQANSAPIRMAYADLLLRTNRPAEADAAVTLALAVTGFAANALDYDLAMVVAYKRKDFARALTYSDHALALDRHDANRYVNRASIFIDQQRWEDVYTCAQQALALNPDSSMANMMMAVGVMRTNRGTDLANQYQAKAKQLDAAGK